MRKNRPALFPGRHFQDHVIVLCVRWVLRYAPELNKRIRGEIRPPNRVMAGGLYFMRESGKRSREMQLNFDCFRDKEKLANV